MFSVLSHDRIHRRYTVQWCIIDIEGAKERRLLSGITPVENLGLGQMMSAVTVGVQVVPTAYKTAAVTQLRGLVPHVQTLGSMGIVCPCMSWLGSEPENDLYIYLMYIFLSSASTFLFINVTRIILTIDDCIASVLVIS